MSENISGFDVAITKLNINFRTYGKYSSKHIEED